MSGRFLFSVSYAKRSIAPRANHSINVSVVTNIIFESVGSRWEMVEVIIRADRGYAAMRNSLVSASLVIEGNRRYMTPASSGMSVVFNPVFIVFEKSAFIYEITRAAMVKVSVRSARAVYKTFDPNKICVPSSFEKGIIFQNA